MIVVIGGGPAGRYAAMRLAGAGRKVTLVDNRQSGLGGQCLHQGCMVICALNDVARSIEHLQVLTRTGVISHVPSVNFPVLISTMMDIVRTIAGVINTETTDAGVKVITGTAVVDGGVVTLDGAAIDAQAVIIATGSRPYNPPIPGDDLPGVYTAHTILSLPDLPDRMVIIGGGSIAAEMGYIFSVLGTEVTILARSTLLSSFPASLVREARRDLHRVRIIEQASVIQITGEKHADGVMVATAEGSLHIESDAILVATGMKPELTGINGIPINEHGYLDVNERMETGIHGVYAVGDVTGSSWLTPLARRQGRIAADAILGEEPPKPLNAIPQAIKLRNDLAFCGDQNGEGLSVTIPSPAGPGSFWAVPERATGRASMTADKQTGAIIGMLEASPYASVVSAYHALLINAGVSIDQMERFIEVHPSADGTGWTGRYLAEQYEKQRNKSDKMNQG